MKKISSRTSIFLFLSIAVIGLFSIRFFMLRKSAYPSGLDGYYYALQAKSLVQNGQLENPDSAPGFYLCGLMTWLTGDAITGCKAWAALASVLLSVSVFTLLMVLIQNRYRIPCAVAGFMLSAASPSLAQLTINFINNETGLFFFLFYAAAFISLLRSICTEPLSKKRFFHLLFPVFGTIILLVLCCISHLVTAAYALIFTAVLIAQKVPRRIRIWTIPAVCAAAGFCFFRQLPRFAQVFAFGPILPVFSVFFRNRLPFSLVLEISLAFCVTWGSAIFFCIRKKHCPLYVIFVPILFFPFWNLSILDMGYRMFLSAIPCGIVSVVYIASVLLRNKRLSGFRVPATAAAVVLCGGAFLSTMVYDPKHDPPYRYYKSIAQKVVLSDDSLLIAHLGLNHVYTYYQNLRMSLNYIPDFPIPAEKLWRLAYGVRRSAVENCFPETDAATLANLVRRIDAHYLLIREDLWQEFLKREDPEIAATYQNWYNPYTVRPAFIRKKVK